MPPIFPARIFEHDTKDGGFTFVEVIVALGILAILVAAASSSMITSLRAEQYAAQVTQASRICDRLATSDHAGYPNDDLIVDIQKEWELTDASTGTAKEWQVWRLSRLDRPSLSVLVSLRRYMPEK